LRPFFYFFEFFSLEPMKYIEFENPHRQKHFDFFNQMNHPHFNVTANVEITAYFNFIKKKEYSMTPAIVYLITKAAIQTKEFRWRIRENNIVEHATLSPSFAVYTDVADVFSFCTVDFHDDLESFLQIANKESEKMKENPSFEDEEGRDDYLFLSSLPWISFTGFQHAMPYHPTDSVPRMTWGKFIIEDKRILMPLSVQVHHAIVDGRHVGQYFEAIERIAKDLGRRG